MPLTEAERERYEADSANAQHNPADAISIAVGQHVFAHNHRFPDLRASAWRDRSVSSSGLAVSRFYFGARPQVVVDVIAQPSRARNEIAAKRDFCKANGILYVLVADVYDDEGVRQQLLAARAPAPVKAAAKAKRPVAQKRPRAKAAAA
jgi:hypothetical protein